MKKDLTKNYKSEWFHMDKNEVLKILESSEKNGISSQEALKRLEIFGKNEFDKEVKDSLLVRILHHLKEITSIILLFAAIISGYMAITVDDGWMKVIVILSILVINIVIGIMQENKAEKALESLQTISSPNTNILRDGKQQVVLTSELVPGDILILETGDIIPADGRILVERNLEVDESFLTGESLPVEKSVDKLNEEEIPLGDRINMVFSGSTVTKGNGVAVVCGTGMESEMGSIAMLLNSTKAEPTLLQKRLAKLAKSLSIVALIAGIIIFALNIWIHDEGITESLMMAISLAVAAVPETLPVIVTITFAYGIKILAEKRAIVRRIDAVETIGSVSVICSDKTGTLTQNKMTVKDWWIDENSAILLKEKMNIEDELELIGTAFALSNNGQINGEDEIGDPTELALIRFALENNIKKKEIESRYMRIDEFPFESERKLMSTLHKLEDGYLLLTKGAFDRLPAKCVEKNITKAHEKHDEFAAKALRVLAIGYKYLDKIPTDCDWNKLEDDIIFLGIVGMIDPPREEVKSSIEIAKKAGIKIVMITGDHLETAKAIAKELGIFQRKDEALSGSDLLHTSQEELNLSIEKYPVYARVSPDDKIHIVQAWQNNGDIVAMTGDGVNDAPAIKAADVGTAMGITGTDVTKNVADIVLTDDNFSTIVEAIGIGRGVYDNILKTIYFLLSVNFGQIFIMLIAVILGFRVPLIAVQLLLINVVADGIPGFYLSQEKAEDDIMTREPIKPSSGIFANGLGIKIAFQAFLYVLVTLVGYYLGQFMVLDDNMSPSYEIGSTMAFLILAYSSILNIFNVRSRLSVFKTSLKENKNILYSAMVSILIITLVAIIPILKKSFSVSTLSVKHWGVVIVLSLLPLTIQTLKKVLTVDREKNDRKDIIK